MIEDETGGGARVTAGPKRPHLSVSLVAQSVKNPPAMQETTCNAGVLGLIPGNG